MEQENNAPLMTLTQEIRFAVVMYGGISLAIYMNGVAQELFKMVLATAPRADGEYAARPDGALNDTEMVYRKLGRMLSWGGATRGIPADDPEEDIRTRFVVDILSGSSAGGINAVYLAKALANDQPMDELKKLWITEGDMGVLINDGKSVEDIRHLGRQIPPRSLLNGSRMYWKLLDALDGMEGDPPGNHPRSRNVEELDLYVTATDMAGQPVKLQLADKVVEEYRHRNVFHFRYRDGEPNDFLRRDNPFLAFAARCTSAHPAAFEPMRLGDANEILGRYPSGRPDQRSGAVGWRRFFEEYLKPAASSDLVESFLQRDFNDGGVLDNRPFRHATDAMPLRRASIPVSRKLVYLDPAPESLEDEDHTQDGSRDLLPKDRKGRVRWTVIKNAWQSLSTLPRYEPIREDLQRVLERNRLIERVGAIVEGMEKRDFRSEDAKIERRASAARQARYSDEDWDRTTMSEMIQARGLAWAGYQHLRVTEATDDLALLITRVAGFDDDSDEFRAVREIVRRWRDRNYDPDGKCNKQTEHAFLRRFDISWRLRRLRYVLARTDRMLLENHTRDMVKQATGLEQVDETTLQEIRQRLRSIRERLSDAQTKLRKDRNRLWEDRKDNPLQDAVRGLNIGSRYLETLLERRKPEELDKLVRRMSAGNRDQIEEFTELVEQCVGTALRFASGRCNRTLSAPPLGRLMSDASAERIARRAVRFHYDDFASYDMISHPILYSTGVGEEMARVDVFRISPRDAKSLIDEEAIGKPKLAGTKLNNFGAFFEEKFRTNDILWGRLDGAERIITALLPKQEDIPERDELIKEAHRAILEEDAEKVFEAWDSGGKDPLTYFQERFHEEYGAKRRFDPQRLLPNAGRASRVFGDVLGGYEAMQRRLSLPVVWLTRLMQLFWLLVEVAVPGSVPSLVFRHGLKLLYVFELATIFLGWLASSPPVLRLGVAALVATGTVNAIVWFLGDLMAGEGRWWWKAVRVSLISLVSLVFVLGLILALGVLGTVLDAKELERPLRFVLEAVRIP